MVVVKNDNDEFNGKEKKRQRASCRKFDKEKTSLNR